MWDVFFIRLLMPTQKKHISWGQPKNDLENEVIEHISKSKSDCSLLPTECKWIHIEEAGL